MTQEFTLSTEGLTKLKEELDFLKTVRRKEIADRIKEAIEYGDLSENDEYRVAREEQAFTEGRIVELETILRHAKVVSADQKNDSINIGSRVIVDSDGKETYEIVGANESDPAHGKISADSPIGRALVGHQAGETVEVATPAGTLNFKIVKVQ